MKNVSVDDVYPEAGQLAAVRGHALVGDLDSPTCSDCASEVSNSMSDSSSAHRLHTIRTVGSPETVSTLWVAL